MSFADRLKSRMRETNIKASAIAVKAGVSRGTVSQWVNGIAEPSGSNATTLALVLHCNINWLMHGKGAATKQAEQNVERGPDLRGKVPLVSWIQAGNWLEMEQYSQDFAEWVTHTANVSDNAFALRVRGDSMTSRTGRSIPDGSIAIIDPAITAEHGKVVVARLDNTGATTLKELVIDGSQRYLRAFNSDYPMQLITESCTIIGVVKQVIQEF